MNLPSVIVDLVAVQCVQIGVLFVLIWCAGRWLLRDRPFLAHGLWVLLLIKCLTPPVWASEVGVFSWVYYEPSASAPVRDVPEPLGTVVNDPRLIREMKDKARALPAVSPVNKVVSHPSAQFLKVAVPHEGREGRVHWPSIALAIWGFGTAILLMVALGRFLLYRRKIFREVVAHDERWDACIKTLRERLGVRRRVKLVLTRDQVGAAVFGLFRPTIVLPAEIVASRSPSELEPILAHELIHIRHGDLWIGLLQLITGAMWWFYPPVWIAIRRTSRTSEECCDLAVVNALPDARRAYADLLLEFLARGHSLRAVPLVPGMRPGEITFRRMERIMTMRTKANRSATCIRWLLLLGLAVVVLPGAGQDNKEENEPNKISPVVAKTDVNHKLTQAEDVDDPLVVIAYGLPHVYDHLAEIGLNREGTQHYLSGLIENLDNFEFPEFDATVLRSVSELKHQTRQHEQRRRDEVRAVWTDDGSLIVRATRSVHDRIEHLLSALSETGLVFYQASISTGVMKTPDLDRVGDWRKAGTFKAVKVTETSQALASDIVEQGALTYAIISPEQWKKAKPSGFTSELPVTAAQMPELHFGATCHGRTGRFFLSMEHHWRTLPLGRHVRMMPEGIEGTMCVEVTDDAANGHISAATARINLAYVRYELPKRYGIRLADKDRESPPHIVYQETAQVEIPTTLGQTILIRRGQPEASLRDWDGEFVIAITLKKAPIEISYHVGTDEFRIEPSSP